VPIALERLESAIELIQQVGVGPDDTWTNYGNLTWVVGKLPEAIRIFEGTIRSAEERGVKNHGRISIDEIFLSHILREQNQLDKALLHINRAIAYTRWWPSHSVIAMAYSAYAQILLTLQYLKGSIQVIENAERERKNRFMNPNVHNFVEETWGRVWLAHGNWKLLERWSKKQEMALSDSIVKDYPIDELLETRLILVIRFWIEKNRLDQKKERYQNCLSILEHLENSSRRSGRGNSLVVVLLYKAIALFHQEKRAMAFSELDRCFELAEPGGYVRIFLDIGESSRALIYAYLQQSDANHKSYALKIMLEFSNLHSDDKPKEVNPDALTSRETEILQLLAEGYSNRKIAERLVLSEGTIKFHVHNILGKLYATNRTQAIAKARDLKLI
jgi:LuxR family maltose regulon positive regulatory protein